MFSGIVEEIGIIQEITATSLTIQAQKVLADLEEKDSIAVDGTCLTVIARGATSFTVETVPETVRRTRLRSLRPGDRVNLERSVPASGRIGGHTVQGHIEATVRVRSVEIDGIALLVAIELPEALRPYVVPKGFIALNGVSLTVIEVFSDHFTITLIPYTREHTNLGEVQPGTLLNVETDILGRYVVQYLALQQKSEPAEVLFPNLAESRSLQATYIRIPENHSLARQCGCTQA